MPDIKRVHAADLDWRRVEGSAQRILRICSDIGFVAPEDGARHQQYVEQVCEQLGEIVAALHITPPGGK
jgi:hypothetical protein